MATEIAPIVSQARDERVHGSGLTMQVVPIEWNKVIASSNEPTPFRPVPRPTRVSIGTLSDQGFRVVKPITLDVETRDDSVVATWAEIDEFGAGPSTSDAIEELGRTVAELYRSLQVEQENLGPDLHRVWDILREFVVPRR